VRDQIEQWQLQAAVQPEDSVTTLHQLREARDANRAIQLQQLAPANRSL
jgi:hypothetical protein